jgi:hypothetical protein
MHLEFGSFYQFLSTELCFPELAAGREKREGQTAC